MSVELLTWDRNFWVATAKQVYHIGIVRVWGVEASNFWGGWIIVGVRVPCCTEANSGSIIPLHETTLVGEEGVWVVPISDQDGLEGILLQK